MAFQTKMGSIVLPTSAGSIRVENIPFQPKALIMWNTRQTATGFANDSSFNVGFAASATQRVSSSIRSLDATAAATATSVRLATETFCLVPAITAGAAKEMTLDLASMNNDGFTLTLATPGATAAYIAHYLALGGSDLTNAFVGVATPTTGTGNKAITGVGFQPDCVLTLENSLISPFGAGGNSNANMQLGAFTAKAGMTTHWRTIDSVNPTQTLQYQRTDKMVGVYSSTADTLDHEATLVSMDSDGFTLNYTTRANANTFMFLALKGGKYDVRSETQGISVGTKITTELGFKPRGLLLMGQNAVANSSVDLTQGKMSLGASDGISEGSIWGSVTDNVATSETRQVTLTDKIIRHATNPSTTNAEADLVSFDQNGYTLNWTTADATARQFISVAFGNNSDARPSDTPIYDFGAGSA